MLVVNFSRDAAASVTLVTMLVTALGLATVFIVGDLIEERVSKSKHLQFIAGVKPVTYWVSAFLWDYAVYSLTVPILVIMLVLMDEEYFTSPELIDVFLTFMFVFG